MKNLLNKTVKVKHVLIVLVLLVGMSIGFILNKPNHRFPRHKQMVKFEQRGRQMGNQFNRRNFRHDFSKLSDIEKQSIDSLKSLIVKGNRDDNKIIFEQIREIVKRD